MDATPTGVLENTPHYLPAESGPASNRRDCEEARQVSALVDFQPDRRHKLGATEGRR